MLRAQIPDEPDNHRLGMAVDGLIALAPRLEPGELRRAADALLAILPKSPLFAASGLAELAPRLETAQATLAWNTLIATVGKPDGPRTQDDIPGKRQQRECAALKALALRLEPAQVKLAWAALMTTVGKSHNTRELYMVGTALEALAPRLQQAQVEFAGTALIEILQKSEVYNQREAVVINAFTSLAPRLEATQAKITGNALIAIARKTTDSEMFRTVTAALIAMAARLEPSQVQRALDSQIEILQKALHDLPSPPWKVSQVCDTLIALASRLKSTQAKLAWNALIETPGSAADCGGLTSVEASLEALAPRFEGEQRDNCLTMATTVFLDYGSSFITSNNQLFTASASIPFVNSLSSRRALARLLSHPGCVAQLRLPLLQRFEELVLYDGRSVFLKPKKPNGTRTVRDQPPRHRFHNLHDAAAWIQQNWPDFDLETNCPVTWRGSR
jgi:hypothetical protein